MYGVVLTMLFGWFTLSKAQTTRIIPGTKYIIDIWEQEDGLPQNTVNNVIQDADGYLWIATFGGLSRFDGHQFTNYNRNTLEGLYNDRILVVQNAGDRKLVIAENHIFILDDSGISEIANPLDKSSFVDIQYLGEDVYFLKDIHGFSYRYTDNKLVSLPSIINDNVNFYYFTQPDGRVIRLHPDGFDLVTPDEFIPLGTFAEPITPEVLRRIFAAFIDADNKFWYSVEKEFVRKQTLKGWDEIWIKDYKLHNEPYVLTINQDLDGQIWVGTSSGFGYLNGTHIKHVDMNVLGYTSMYVKGFLIDVENNLWFSTRTNGLIRLRQSPVRTFASESGLIRDSMLSLYIDKEDTFWAGTNCGGLYVKKGDQFELSEYDALLANKCIWSILKDRKGRLVIGSFGVEIIDGTKHHRISSEKGILSNWIFAIMEDPKKDGVIWVGSSDDVFVIHEENRIEQKFKLSNLEVKTFMLDLDGETIWAGTNRGVLRFKDGQLMEYIPEIEGRRVSVRSLYQEPDGTLWIGTYNDGIIRYKNEAFDVIGQNEGVFDVLISHLLFDDEGHLWAGSNRGIARYELAELHAIADKKSTKVNPLVLTRSDGMLSSETNGGFYPSAIKDKQGLLWFPTIRGIVQVDPSKIKRNHVVPKVRIEHVLSGGEAFEYNSQEPASFSHNAGRLDIHYTVLSLSDAKKNKFRYILEPVEQQWTENITNRYVTYSKLAPGSYTFKVMGSNNDGVWSNEASVFRFRVRSPWYLTIWAYISYVLISFGMVGAYVRYRKLEFQIRERIQQELTEQLIHTLEAERKRIAMEMHDGFGQYISVIRNRAQMGLKDVQNSEAVRYHLKEIEESASLTLTDLRKISNNLRPVHLERLGLSDTLDAIMESVKDTTTLQVDTHIDEHIDELIPEGADIHLYRIVQEAITNSLKHAGASHIRLSLKKTDNAVMLSYQDNGKGFDDTSIALGNGIVGMRERARLIKSELSMRSKPGQGLLIEIIIPTTS